MKQENFILITNSFQIINKRADNLSQSCSINQFIFVSYFHDNLTRLFTANQVQTDRAASAYLIGFKRHEVLHARYVPIF